MKIELTDDVERIEIEPNDGFDLFVYLAKINLATLTVFRENTFSTAMVDNEDVPSHLWRPVTPPLEDWRNDENSHNRWMYVLDEMINAFETIIETDSTGPYPEDERVQNGLRLFAKYFTNLWI